MDTFFIDVERIEALRRDLGKPAEAARCLEELKTIKEIKEGLLWRAEAGPCCFGPGLAGRLYGQVKLLEDALEALLSEEFERTASILAEVTPEI